MRLTRLRGLAHDLANHLDNQFWLGYYKDLNKVNSNILEHKNQFDKSCAEFFKKRLPKDFDMDRIKKIQVKVDRVGWKLTIMIRISVDGKEFNYTARSITSFA